MSTSLENAVTLPLYNKQRTFTVMSAIPNPLYISKCYPFTLSIQNANGSDSLEM